MNPYCLNTTELNRFLEIEFENGKFDDDEDISQSLLENWRLWYTEFICTATSFSIILEQRQKNDRPAGSLLRKVYSLLEDSGHWLTIEGFGEDFVDYLLRHSRTDGLSIEDDLIAFRSYFSGYDYSRRNS